MTFVESDPMPARHVFKFAVSGIELSEEHQRVVAERVAQAGAEAIASLDFGPRAEIIIDLREWLGRWLHLLEERRIAEQGIQISPETVQGILEGGSFGG